MTESYQARQSSASLTFDPARNNKSPPNISGHTISCKSISMLGSTVRLHENEVLMNEILECQLVTRTCFHVVATRASYCDTRWIKEDQIVRVLWSQQLNETTITFKKWARNAPIGCYGENQIPLIFGSHQFALHDLKQTSHLYYAKHKECQRLDACCEVSFL